MGKYDIKETMSSTHNRTGTHLNSQRLWQKAQGLYKMGASAERGCGYCLPFLTKNYNWCPLTKEKWTFSNWISLDVLTTLKLSTMPSSGWATWNERNFCRLSVSYCFIWLLLFWSFFGLFLLLILSFSGLLLLCVLFLLLIFEKSFCLFY